MWFRRALELVSKVCVRNKTRRASVLVVYNGILMRQCCGVQRLNWKEVDMRFKMLRLQKIYVGA